MDIYLKNLNTSPSSYEMTAMSTYNFMDVPRALATAR
jgi:hypothetical protein